MLSTIDEVLSALGGPAKVVELAGLKSPSAPSNWKARGRIPPEHFLVFSRVAREQGKEIDPALFGFVNEAESA